MSQKLIEHQENIIRWAHLKGLLEPSNADRQFLKILEETGETAKAILKNDLKEIIDGIGDMFVTVVIYHAQKGIMSRFDYLKTGYDTHESFGVFLSFIKDPLTPFTSLHNIARSKGLTLEECVETAWNEIKDRTGKTENGIFIKQADLAASPDKTTHDKGCRITCHTPYISQVTGKKLITEGKPYEILKSFLSTFVIIDDEGDENTFAHNEFNEYFSYSE